MVKLLHAADFHLDSPYRSLNAQQARQRRQEGRSNLLRLTQFANAGDVDIVLLAGDLFDSGELYRETMEMLAKALAKLRDVFLLRRETMIFGIQMVPMEKCNGRIMCIFFEGMP